MNRAEHLLVILAEEAAEVAKEAAKCLRFGPDETYAAKGITNAERVVDELIDLLALVEMLQDEKILRQSIFCADRIDAKKRKVEAHLAYSKQCGTFQESELRK